MFYTIDNSNEWKINEYDNEESAKNAIKIYENIDKIMGSYEPDSYSIIEK